MKIIFLSILIPLFVIETSGQDSVSMHKKVYSMNYKVEIPVTVGLWATSIYGFYLLGQKPTLDINQINALDKNDIWAFDRGAVEQSYPAPSNIYTVSDIALWTSYFLPALLFIDKEIRSEWLDITVLYFESQAINLNIYLWGGPVFTDRIRPVVYYDETSTEYKLGQETTDSFFSGHVSIAAGASFFMAKVLSDYHPEWGAKKILVYTAALIPPVIVGYARYRGFMHFPTDLMVGFGVGAAVGILVPHLHKLTRKKNKDLSIVPFSGPYSGLAFSMRL